MPSTDHETGLFDLDSKDLSISRNLSANMASLCYLSIMSYVKRLQMSSILISLYIPLWIKERLCFESENGMLTSLSEYRHFTLVR